ncbi:MAG TPA: response regulator transcription factor [Anaerolineae bacterium]|nr:response regulator transcription factor [Anaerolineae bacterium]
MTDLIRVLIVDDHPLVREGLRAVLGQEPGLEIVGEAADGIAALAAVQRLRPDVIVMDVLMPTKDGLEAAADILRLDPAARVLLLTSVTNLERIRPTIRAGALGYISKSAPPEELEQAIRTLYRGGVYLPANLARYLLQSPGGAASSEPPAALFTERELEILKLVAQGLGNDDIAARFTISPRTVGVHISHILDKLGLDNRTQAALYALRQGLVSLQPAPETE